MKFTSILRSLIVENSRFEVLFNALTKPQKNEEGETIKPKLSKDEFIALVTGDPDTRLNNVDPESKDPKELAKIKVGKYSQWLIKKYLNPETESQPGDPVYSREAKQVKDTFIEDLYKVTNDLMKFERFKSRLPEDKRDINKLSVKDLYELVKDFSLEKTKASKEEKQAASVTYEHPGGEIAFRGKNWTVAKISDTGKLGKDAACFYGGYYLEPSKGETRWCTSSPGLDWFTRYIKDGPLYVVIPNEFAGKKGEKSGLPAERYQFHFPSNQFMDVHDHGVNLVELLNGKMSELKEYFKPEFAKGLTHGGEKLVIDSFTHGAIGKFIALYGLNDLMESLPENLKHFQIINKDRDSKIEIQIPQSIGKFQNLQFIMFDNCVSSIPDSICQLQKLRFLSVVNCPDLKTVPECIADLPNLYFLNLKGSTNVTVPQRILDKSEAVGDNMFDFASEK